MIGYNERYSPIDTIVSQYLEVQNKSEIQIT